uniref:hypothetical protein n=1 Tax=Streptomyces atratus TaxID=1893 RepID=UPI002F912A57
MVTLTPRVPFFSSGQTAVDGADGVVEPVPGWVGVWPGLRWASVRSWVSVPQYTLTSALPRRPGTDPFSVYCQTDQYLPPTGERAHAFRSVAGLPQRAACSAAVSVCGRSAAVA